MARRHRRARKRTPNTSAYTRAPLPPTPSPGNRRLPFRRSAPKLPHVAVSSEKSSFRLFFFRNQGVRGAMISGAMMRGARDEGSRDTGGPQRWCRCRRR